MSDQAQRVSEWGETVRAAQREGVLVVYSAARGNPVIPGLVKNFERTYGIEVRLEEARTEVMSERIRAEQRTNDVRGDVSINGATASAVLAGERRFTPARGLPNFANLHAELAGTGDVIPVFVVPYGLLVNTDLVAPADRPKRWADLLDPRWRGKILCDDMREIGAGGVLFAALHALYGEEFHRAFAAQRPCFSLESRTLEQRVARGEFAILAPLTWPNLADLAGQPVAGFVPAEGAPFVGFQAALITGAKRAASGRLFLNFLLDGEAQRAFQARGFGSVIRMAEANPSRTPPLLSTTDPARAAEMLARAREIYRDVPSTETTAAR